MSDIKNAKGTSSKLQDDMEQCIRCNGSGCWDGVHRPTFDAWPKELMCGVCGGRGWCLKSLNEFREEEKPGAY